MEAKVAIGISVYLAVLIIVVAPASFMSFKNHKEMKSTKMIQKKSEGRATCTLKSVSQEENEGQGQNPLVQLFPVSSSRENQPGSLYYSKPEIEKRRKSLPKLTIPPPRSDFTDFNRIQKSKRARSKVKTHTLPDNLQGNNRITDELQEKAVESQMDQSGRNCCGQKGLIDYEVSTDQTDVKGAAEQKSLGVNCAVGGHTELKNVSTKKQSSIVIQVLPDVDLTEKKN